MRQRRWMVRVLAVLVLALPGLIRADGNASAPAGGDPGVLNSQLVGANDLPNWHAEGPNLIRLLAGAFDPLADAPPVPPGTNLVNDVVLPAGQPQYWLVQVRDRRFADVRAAAEAAGATVAGYVHDDTYMVRATPAQRLALAASPAVRWTGFYQPAWRFAPTVDGIPGLLDVTGTQTYRVSLFRMDPAPEAAVAALRAIPGVEVQGVQGRVVTVRGTAAQVPLIAAVPAVEWVGGDVQAVPLNAEARWVIDTAVRDVRSATSASRLDGAGQTAGVADTGVNYIPDRNGRAHVAFSDCSAAGCKEADYTQAEPGFEVEQIDGVQANGTGHRKMAAYFDLGKTGPNMYDESSHGTHTAGSVASDAGALGTADGHDGMAPAARLVHQNVADDTGGLGGIPSDLYDLFRQAYRPSDPASVAAPAIDTPSTDYDLYRPNEDARTHNNSWGAALPFGLDIGYAYALDWFVWDHEDMTIVVSAGNGGPGLGTTGTPSSAKNALTSGASSNGRQPMVAVDSMASFSSHGPTADGRYGVDLATPGETVISPKGGTESDYHTAQGTSMSGPVLTGAATLVRQYFFDGYGPAAGTGFAAGSPAGDRSWNPSAALVTATMVNGATRMTGHYTGDDGRAPTSGQYPSAGQGFGLVNLDRALYFDDGAGRDPANNFFVDVWRGDERAFPISNLPATQTYEIEVAEGEPLDVALAWTDAPTLAPAGTPALVNNLDLMVTGPSGEPLFGNNFNTRVDPGAEEAESLPGPLPDVRNNIEKVRLADPEPGTYTITVLASPVAFGPQGFALAASGNIAEPGGTFEPGPELLADAEGAPAISDVKITPVSADLTMVSFETSEPTTGAIEVNGGDVSATYTDVYKTGPDGYQGRPGGHPDEPSAKYSETPVTAWHHEVYVAGLSPGQLYNATIVATDLGENQTTAPTSFTSPANVFQPLADDTGFFGDGATGAHWGSSPSAKQMYAGNYADENLFGAFMFRMPESVDPSKLIGATVELTAAHDWANRYTVDPVFTVDLLDDAVEPSWGTQDGLQIQSAPADARVRPETTMREGGLTAWSFSLTCADLGALRQNLAASDGERRAAFRFAAEIDGSGIVSAEFGYNRRSRGLQYRPKLVLHYGANDAPPLGGCDPNTPAPTISDVGIHPGLEPSSMTVSWKTDVDSTSVVLFRPKGTTDFTQVGTLARTQVHQVQVRGLDPAKEYEFAVRSAACNGATTTADNGGKGWDFFRRGDETEVAFYDWEADDEGWTASVVDHRGDPTNPAGPSDSQWGRAEPGAGGSAAGQHVSPYGDQQEAVLSSPALPVSERVIVEFAERHDLEDTAGLFLTLDALKLDYSSDGVTWHSAAVYQGLNESYPEFDTRRVEFNVPAGDLQLRFVVVSDDNISSPLFTGAGVDQVRVLTSASEPLPSVGPVPPPSAGARRLGAASVPTRLAPTTADVAAGTMTCGVPAAASPGGGGGKPPKPPKKGK